MSKKIFRTIGKVAGVVASVASFIPGVGQVVAGVAAVVSLGASLLAGKPKTPQASPADRDRLIANIDTRTPRKIVYGRTAMATDIRDQEFTGANKEYFHRFIVVAAHKVRSIERIWFDDKLAWTSAGGVQGEYASYLTVDVRLEGTAANAINISPRMGSTRRYTGLAYIHLRYKLTGNNSETESPFSQSIPTRITVVGDAMPIYDPRKDPTYGGTGSHRADDQSTWDWGTTTYRNPPLQLLNYLLGWRINGKLSVGKGLPIDRIDIASFIAAANMCDEAVTLAAGGVEPRYRTDGIFSEADRMTLVLDQFKSSMNATLDDVDGLIRVQVLHNDLALPVASFDEGDILGEVNWKPQVKLTDQFTIMRGTHTDASDNSLFQSVAYPELEVASEDGIDRIETVNYPMVQSASQCQRLAKQRLQRMAFGGTFSADYKSSAWKAQKGDIIAQSFPALGFTGKLFRVVDTDVKFNGVVSMLLREEDPALYLWDAEESPAVIAATPDTYDFTKNPLYGVTEGADWPTNVANRPGNVASLIGTEPIDNTRVSIGSNGALSGAGGGQVTIPGLGGGALAFEDFAEWGSSVSGRPTELIDGRIGSAIRNDGYLQRGFHYPGATGPIEIPEILSSSAGRNIATNNHFRNDLAGYFTYDNAGSGHTVISRIAFSATPNPYGVGMRIAYDGNGTPATAAPNGPTPGFGGFRVGWSVSNFPQINRYTRGSTIDFKILARIPVGRQITWASNAIGTGSTVRYLTGRDGTGDWFEYVIRVKIGETGSHSTTGFWYILGGTNTAFNWDVARFDAIVVSDSPGVFIEQHAIKDDGNPLIRGDYFNNEIAINSGNIFGIGSGVGTPVANSLISIGSNGALTGGAGGQVTLPGIGFSGDTNAERNSRIDFITDNLGTGGRGRFGFRNNGGVVQYWQPTSRFQNFDITIAGNNLNGIGSGAGTAVRNTGVSMGTNGALSGGGGGQVTLPGLGGESGADVTKMMTGPASLTVNLNSDGTVKGSLPSGIVNLTTSANVNISSGVSWTVTVNSGSFEGAAPSISGTGTGQVMINSKALTQGELFVKATHLGRTYTGVIAVVIDQDAPPTGGSSGSGSSNPNSRTEAVSGTMTNSGAWVTLADLTIAMAAGVTEADLIASGHTLFPGGNGSTAESNVQYRWRWDNGSTLVQVGLVANSFPDPVFNNESGFPFPEPGSITCNRTQSGLTAGSDQRFVLEGRISGGGQQNVVPDGSATADGS